MPLRATIAAGHADRTDPLRRDPAHLSVTIESGSRLARVTGAAMLGSTIAFPLAENVLRAVAIGRQPKGICS